MLTKKPQPQWYLLYTNPRSEKKVNTELILKGYETYLPLQKVLKQWSDRKKWVEEPLFKSYLFIKTDLEKNVYNILNVPGIVKFVNFERKPVVVHEKDIQMIKVLLGNFSHLETETYAPKAGDIVEIVTGALAGYRAKLISAHGNKQVYIEMPEIMQSIKINIPLHHIKPINSL